MLLAPFGALVMCGLLVVKGHLAIALVLVAVLFAVFQARHVSPRFARGLEHGLAAAAHALAHGVGLVLSWGLLTLVFVCVVVPVSLLALPFKGRFGRGRGTGDGWAQREAHGPTTRPRRGYGAEPGRARRLASTPAPVPGPATPTIGASPDAPRVVVAPPRTDRTWSRRLLQALAVVLVLMVLDLVLGAVLATTGRLPGTQGDVRRQIEAAITATMDAPAVRSEPWAQGFGEDMAAFELQEPHYLPYLVRGFQPFESTYVNTTAEERMSYRPTQPAGVDPLRVAFFGGSTMFGVGQRDEHTIPSEFARLAEDAGVAVEVHNYGFPGWVSWQEFQYLERLLAEDERYDLVVFFDGFNEFQVQQDQFSPDPTHNGAAATDQLAQDFHDEHERPPGYFDWVHDLTSAYTENSAVSRLVERLRGDDEVLSTPSGATPDQQADAALDIYGRSRQMITDLTGQDPPVQFFWQPRKGGWPASVTDRLPPSVADISHVLDGREDDVYIDEVHTNEEGARLIAAAMWDELGAGLERLGDDR